MARLRIAFVGAGSLGEQMATHMSRAGSYEIAGWFDDAWAPGETVRGLPVFGGLDAVEKIHDEGRFDAVQLALGDQQLPLRHALWKRLEGRVPIETFVARDVSLADDAELGEGCFVYPGCVVDLRARLGPVNVLQVGCTLAHDARFDEANFLGPGVTLSGFVTVGSRCLLGVGSTVLPEVTIGDDVVVGGGAVVTRDLGEPGIYVGVPARGPRT